MKKADLKTVISGIVTDLNKNKLFSLNANILLDCKFTETYLKKIGFEWAEINKNYIKNYFKYFKDIKYFD